MEVHLAADQQTQLDRLAQAAGRTSASDLMKDVALHILQNDADFDEAVLAGLAQADRDELIDEPEMDLRVERLLSRSQYRLATWNRE